MAATSPAVLWGASEVKAGRPIECDCSVRWSAIETPTFSMMSAIPGNPQNICSMGVLPSLTHERHSAERVIAMSAIGDCSVGWPAWVIRISLPVRTEWPVGAGNRREEADGTSLQRRLIRRMAYRWTLACFFEI